ncbi:MAG TPA: SRPBCC family protein [Opitutaceae bacterium]|nr:SRPBCC family protein [Opitutaceae bacterium]
MNPILAPTPAPCAARARAVREHAFVVPLPPAECFVFFEPAGEKLWAEDWQPVFATPQDATLHDGSVFTVERPHPHGGAPIASVWTITQYDPPRAIEYRNVLAGLRATRILVRCEPAGAATRVVVRYVYTGLSDEGDAAIREVTPAAFAQSLEGWGAAIAAYLRRGTPASP